MLLIISASTILAAVSILNTYIVHDLNGLDANTLCTVHEQDPVMARHERRNYTRAIVHMLYNIIHAYIAHMQLPRFLEQLCLHMHANIKFQLSCTVCHMTIIHFTHGQAWGQVHVYLYLNTFKYIFDSTCTLLKYFLIPAGVLVLILKYQM